MIDANPLPVQRSAGNLRWIGLVAVALLLSVGGLDGAAVQKTGAAVTGRSLAAVRNLGNGVRGPGADGSVLPGQRVFLARSEQAEQSKGSSLRWRALVIALVSTASAVRGRRRTEHLRQRGSVELPGSVLRRGPPAYEFA